MMNEMNTPMELAIETVSTCAPDLTGPVRQQLQLMQGIANLLDDAIEYGRAKGRESVMELLADLAEELGIDEDKVDRFREVLIEMHGE